jgi:hypothetical protein
MTYPQTPGAWAGSAQTAFDARDVVAKTAPKMLDRCESYIIKNGPASAEEVTEGIRLPGEHLLLTSVRARICQLHRLGRLKDSGERSLGESLRAKVVRWRASTPDELAAFLAKQEESANG